MDGLVTFTLDSNEEMEVGRNLGIDQLRLFSRIPYGGGASASTGVHPRDERGHRVRPPLRGTSCNQIDDVEHVLVTAGTGVPTSGLILGRDR